MLFTSSIFIVAYTSQISDVKTAKQVYGKENVSCASDYFSPPQTAPKLKTQGNRFPCGLLGKINGSDTLKYRPFGLSRKTIGTCRMIRHVHWLKSLSIISINQSPVHDSRHFRLCFSYFVVVETDRNLKMCVKCE